MIPFLCAQFILSASFFRSSAQSTESLSVILLDSKVVRSQKGFNFCSFTTIMTIQSYQ